MAEWIPGHTKWEKKDLNTETALNVFFLNTCPEEWTYSTDPIYRANIIQWSNGPSGWSNCFNLGSDQNDSQIRVQFQRKFKCTSMYVSF